MTRFSASLGFLWAELPLPDAIHAAAEAGFDAVECHFPYQTPPHLVAAALQETGLKMLGINTRPGDRDAHEFGLAALPHRSEDARAAIDEAIAYAVAIRASAVHVMAGFANGAAAHKTFVDNLRYACSQAAVHKITILIAPLNHYDAPGYHLKTTTQASDIIREVWKTNLKIQFDCYHVQLMEGDLTHRLEKLMPQIGHIQFAGVPARGRPDQGELNYAFLFEAIKRLGYDRPLGAEYLPGGPTPPTLGWMTRLR